MSYVSGERISEGTSLFFNHMKQAHLLLCESYGRRFANEMSGIFFNLLQDSTPHYLEDMVRYLKGRLESVLAGEQSTYPTQQELKNQIKRWILQKYQEDLLKDQAPHVPKLMQQIIEIEIKARDEAIARAEAAERELAALRAEFLAAGEKRSSKEASETMPFAKRARTAGGSLESHPSTANTGGEASGSST